MIITHPRHPNYGAIETNRKRRLLIQAIKAVGSVILGAAIMIIGSLIMTAALKCLGLLG